MRHIELKWALAWAVIALWLHLIGHDNAAIWALIIGGLVVPVVVLDHL